MEFPQRGSVQHAHKQDESLSPLIERLINIININKFFHLKRLVN